MAHNVRLVIRFVLEQMGCLNIEIFPKQDRVDAETSYGNFINAPLFWQHVRRGRTVFVDEKMTPYHNQWDFLASIRRVSGEVLDRVIQEHDLLEAVNETSKDRSPDSSDPGSATFGLRPCSRRMLERGVEENQRSACFRLAVQLRKTGLPANCTVAVLKVWAGKNRPSDGQAIISDREIETQTSSAYKPRGYRACGCGDEAVRPFCAPTCSLYEERRKGRR